MEKEFDINEGLERGAALCKARSVLRALLDELAAETFDVDLLSDLVSVAYGLIEVAEAA